MNMISFNNKARIPSINVMFPYTRIPVCTIYWYRFVLKENNSSNSKLELMNFLTYI